MNFLRMKSLSHAFEVAGIQIKLRHEFSILDFFREIQKIFGDKLLSSDLGLLFSSSFS